MRLLAFTGGNTAATGAPAPRCPRPHRRRSVFPGGDGSSVRKLGSDHAVEEVGVSVVMGIPKMDGLKGETPFVEMDDLGVSLFQETTKWVVRIWWTSQGFWDFSSLKYPIWGGKGSFSTKCMMKNGGPKCKAQVRLKDLVKHR